MSWLRRHALGLAGLAVVFLIAAELVARFAVGLGEPVVAELDPEIEYMLRPSREYHRFGNRIAINSHRMRAAEFRAERGEGELRVMLVGDSVVYGNHFIDQRDTVAAQLRDLLKERTRCEPVVGAIASSSWGPMNMWAFVRRFGWFDADAVMVVLSSHDLEDTPLHVPDLVPYRLRASRLALEDGLLALANRVFRPPPDPRHTSTEERRVRSREALGSLLDSARRQGAETHFFFHPTRGELQGEADPTHALPAFRETARAHGTPVVDLREAYQAADATGASLYRDTIHPVARGANVLARAMLQQIGDLAADCPAGR